MEEFVKILKSENHSLRTEVRDLFFDDDDESAIKESLINNLFDILQGEKKEITVGFLNPSDLLEVFRMMGLHLPYTPKETAIKIDPIKDTDFEFELAWSCSYVTAGVTFLISGEAYSSTSYIKYVENDKVDSDFT